MLKVVITYPQKEEERAIIRQNLQAIPTKINAVVSTDEILEARQLVREIYMDEKIEQYILDIVFATRFPDQYKLAHLKNWISFGASPRASISLALAAKAYAFIKRRGYVIPEDIRAVCTDVMRHRIGVTYEAEAENKTSVDILHEILNAVEVP
jgi:MoxR-like ATPase